MDLSIIIVTWNNEQEIASCIESLKRTICRHTYEILILDNCSSDKTIDLIKTRFHDVTVFESKENLGFACGNNHMLKHAKGKYVLFLNPDTIMQEKTIDKCVDFLKEDNDYGAVACRLLNDDGSTQPSIYKLPSKKSVFIESFNLNNMLYSSLGKWLGYSHEYSHPIECCMGAFIMMRRYEVDLIGGFTEKYFMYLEDGDLCYKIKHIVKKPIYFISELTCVHLGGRSESKDVTSSKLIKMIDSIEVFAKLYHPQKRIDILAYYRNIYIIKSFIFTILALFLPELYKSKKDIYRKGIKYISEIMKRG